MGRAGIAAMIAAVPAFAAPPAAAEAMLTVVATLTGGWVRNFNPLNEPLIAFNADNPAARPNVFDGTPERLLHLLALEPVGGAS